MREFFAARSALFGALGAFAVAWTSAALPWSGPLPWWVCALCFAGAVASGVALGSIAAQADLYRARRRYERKMMERLERDRLVGMRHLR